MALGYRYLITRKRAQVELTGGEQYRLLAEEYRRLSDMAITSQEHTDLKLGDVSAQLDHLREQMASLQEDPQGRRVSPDAPGRHRRPFASPGSLFPAGIIPRKHER